MAYVQIMEEMAGDLRNGLKKISKIGRLRAAQKIARALATLHAKGYAHLDVKPENILIKSFDDHDNPDVKLADWDLSGKIEKKERIRIGAPLYCDPNIICKTKTCIGPGNAASADQFSFGIMLFEILLGEGPGSTVEIFGSKLEIFRTLAEIRRGDLVTEGVLERHPFYKKLYPEIKEILRDCLIGDNAVREPKMADIATRLQQIINNKGTKLNAEAQRRKGRFTTSLT